MLGISAIVVFGIYSYRTSRKVLTQKTYEHLCTVRDIKQNQLQQYFADRIRDINSLRNSNEVKQLLTNSDKQLNHLYESFLMNYLSSCGYYQQLFIINPDSSYLGLKMECEQTKPMVFTGTSHPIIQPSLNKAAKNGLPFFISDLVNEGDNIKSQLVFGQVTRNDGDLLGWVVLQIPKTYLDSLMLKETTTNKHSISEEAYIIGNDYIMRSASRFDSLMPATINIKNSSTPDVFRLQQGIVNYTDYRGRDVLSAFSTLQTPGLPWAIMVEQDSYEAMHQVRVLYNQSLALIVVISAAFFVFVFFTSRRIVKPILNLRKAASALGDGNFEKELKIESNDEIGDLTETFNNMAFKLKQQQAEIGKERFRRLRAMIDSQELERQRLSKELHEGIGQTLVALKFKTEQLIEKNGQDVDNEVCEIEKLSNGIIEQIRQISNNLAPMVLGEFGLVAAIRFLSDEIMAQSNIKIHVETAYLPPKITGKVRTYLFRIVQEALLNATKHSDAQWIKVSLLGEQQSIKLVLSDNGKGFTANDAKTFGHGLHNMKERVELLKGRLKIESESGEGTTITIIIPYIEPENGKNQANLS